MKLRYLLLIILLSSSVLARPPFEEQIQSAPDQKLIISYPKNEYLLAYSPVKLHFHVYNSSGFLMTSPGISCEFHAYNETGNHIIEAPMLWDSNAKEFYINISAQYALPGYMPYIAWCNDTLGLYGGFESTAIYFGTGRDAQNELSLVGGALVMLVVIFLLFKLGSLLKESEFNSQVKNLIFFTGMFMLVLVPGYYLKAAEILDYPNPMADILGTFYYAVLILLFVMLFLYALKLLIHYLNNISRKKTFEGGGWK